MKDMTSLHLKVQDLVSCYAQTDPLKEMSTVTEGRRQGRGCPQMDCTCGAARRE